MSTEITIKAIELDTDIVAQDGPLSALQIALRDRLLAESHYGEKIAILHENSLDIVSSVDLAIAKLGICIIINTPSATDETPNVPVPYLDKVLVIVQIIENPLINRSATGARVPAGTVGWNVAKDLAATSINGSMVIHKSQRQLVDEELGNVIWNTEFELSLNI